MCFHIYFVFRKRHIHSKGLSCSWHSRSWWRQRREVGFSSRTSRVFKLHLCPEPHMPPGQLHVEGAPAQHVTDASAFVTLSLLFSVDGVTDRPETRTHSRRLPPPSWLSLVGKQVLSALPRGHPLLSLLLLPCSGRLYLLPERRHLAHSCSGTFSGPPAPPPLTCPESLQTRGCQAWVPAPITSTQGRCYISTGETPAIPALISCVDIKKCLVPSTSHQQKGKLTSRLISVWCCAALFHPTYKASLVTWPLKISAVISLLFTSGPYSLTVHSRKPMFHTRTQIQWRETAYWFMVLFS